MNLFRPRVISKLMAALLAGPLLLSTTVVAQESLGTLEELLPPSKSKPGKRSFDARIQLFDYYLFHPKPVWSLVANGMAPAERSQFRRSRAENAFRLDVVPKKESFEDWKSKFSIVAFDKQTHSISTQANRLVGFFKSQCSPTNLVLYPIHRSQDRVVMVTACGNFSRKREKGQMAAAIILKQGDMSVTLMREWKAPAFQAKIESQWPISKQEIDGVLRELNRSRLVPVQG